MCNGMQNQSSTTKILIHHINAVSNKYVIKEIMRYPDAWSAFIDQSKECPFSYINKLMQLNL